MNRRDFLKASAAAAGYGLFNVGCTGVRRPSDRLNLAVIGCGPMSSGNMGAFLRDPRVRVVAVCDPIALSKRHGYNGKTPYMTSTTDSNYPHVSFTDANADYDWGVHNAISNGGNVAGLWRTLNNTMPSDIGVGGDWHCHGGEWNYLVYDRDNNSAYHSEGKYLSGTGNLTLNDMTTVFGAFILPDDYYDMPGAKQQTAGKFGWSYTQDEISDFNIVFLPGAGNRNGTTINSGDGSYWTSSVNPNDSRRACNVWFNATTFLQTASTPSFYMHNGYSVRLVIDAD